MKQSMLLPGQSLLSAKSSLRVVVGCGNVLVVLLFKATRVLILSRGIRKYYKMVSVLGLKVVHLHAGCHSYIVCFFKKQRDNNNA